MKQFLICARRTFDNRTGLYFHAYDESRNQRWSDPTTGHSPNFWGRSMGWWFMALVDVLDYIPEDHPRRADLITMVKGLAITLPEYQDEDGLWYQVLDQIDREGNFPEASVTTQFMYAYAKAVNKGYIDSSYIAVAEKAYDGLRKKLLKRTTTRRGPSPVAVPWVVWVAASIAMARSTTISTNAYVTTTPRLPALYHGVHSTRKILG